MFGDGSLTFQEYAMGESLPLSAIHDAVLEFLRDRDDAVLYGAQDLSGAQTPEPPPDRCAPRGRAAAGKAHQQSVGGVARGIDRRQDDEHDRPPAQSEGTYRSGRPVSP